MPTRARRGSTTGETIPSRGMWWSGFRFEHQHCHSCLPAPDPHAELSDTHSYTSDRRPLPIRYTRLSRCTPGAAGLPACIRLGSAHPGIGSLCPTAPQEQGKSISRGPPRFQALSSPPVVPGAVLQGHITHLTGIRIRHKRICCRHACAIHQQAHCAYHGCRTYCRFRHTSLHITCLYIVNAPPRISGSDGIPAKAELV